MVTAEDIVWVCNPEASWGLVCIQKTPRATNIEHQVILNQVLSLSCVFDENSVAHGMVGNVILHSKVVYTMDGDCPVESVMD